MAKIMTVRGPIAADELGFTSMHEHILHDASIFRKRFEKLLPQGIPLPMEADEPVSIETIGYLRRNFFLCWDALRMDDEALMEAELAEFKASGGDAVVDMSTPGLRSDISAIKRISEKTGVHVITTTGLYIEDTWPERFKEMTVKDLMQYMQKEIDEGVDGTDIRAGHLKVAITDLTGKQERVLQAAARVSNETGLSLTVHPGFIVGSDGKRIVKILQKEGTNLEKVIIAHAQLFFINLHLKTLVQDPESWRLNLDNAKSLLDKGVTLSIDTFGHYYDIELIGYVRPTEWQRLAGLLALIKEGYSPQLVLGTDTYIKILTRRFGGEGYSRLTKFVVPFLTEYLGVFDRVSEFDIRQMTIENPARLLAR
ncbi:MAG: phosphotriesterase [Deltaproteobacteria bacterium]|nr:phosphotriesterase [Deltaproteobacteria bacterium]MBW1960956.1 phosphotriesterase [Deltaproteobacteria bacterium]MBW2152389.1 phosphotriesterase [Deltaproteobacteria bacterium]